MRFPRFFAMLLAMAALSLADREHFLAYGFVHLKQVMDPLVVSDWASQLWPRLGYDQHDRSTWAEDKIHMPVVRNCPVAELAPRAAEAIAELCGGNEHIRVPTWSDGFIANFHYGKGKPWCPPSAKSGGWHKDGDSFLHFLDSPEQALLTIVLFSDVHPRGGGTFISPDSVGMVARYLRDHPEGTLPDDIPAQQLIDQCHDFREATGQAGDVYLMHPYMLHASSYNTLDQVRLIINPPVHFREPMRFDRENPSDHSLVEQAVLRALDCERFVFRPTRPRGHVVPARVAIQAALLAAEQARKPSSVKTVEGSA